MSPVPDPGAGSGRFESLAAVQAAHAALTAAVGQDLLAADAAARVTAFVRRAVAAGSVLDDKDDRAAAQALVNFWAAKLFSAAREAERAAVRRALADQPTAPPVAAPDLGDTLLAPFDPATLAAATAAADTWLAALTDADQQRAARRVLLLLARLRPGAGAPGKSPFEAVPAARAALWDGGPTAAAVDAAVAGLAAAGAVRVHPGETAGADQISLRSSALLETWATLQECLTARQDFRSRAEGWQAAQDGPAPDAALGSKIPAGGAGIYLASPLLMAGALGTAGIYGLSGGLRTSPTTKGDPLPSENYAGFHVANFDVNWRSLVVAVVITAAGVGLYRLVQAGPMKTAKLTARRVARFFRPGAKVLLVGDALEEVRAFPDRSDAERRFIEASRYREMAGYRRNRILAAVFAALVLAAAAGWARAFVLARQQASLAARMRVQRDALTMQAAEESTSNLAISLLLLTEKQHLTHAAKKLLIIQTLGHALFSPPPVSRQGAEQWRQLEERLVTSGAEQKGPWFMGFLRGTRRAEIARVTADGPADREKVTALRAVSADLRPYIVGYPESDAALAAVRPVVFAQLTQVADRVAAAAAEGRTAQDIKAFRHVYWRLYTCEVVLLQDADPPPGAPPSDNALRGATAEFAEALWAWEERPNERAAPAAVKRLAQASDQVRKACEQP